MGDCSDGAEIYSNPEVMSQLDATDIQEDYFELYDLNGDNAVLWSEYSFVNSLNKKASPQARNTFRFLDKLKDWKITLKEFNKARLDRLFEAGSRKKRRH